MKFLSVSLCTFLFATVAQAADISEQTINSIDQRGYDGVATALRDMNDEQRAAIMKDAEAIRLELSTKSPEEISALEAQLQAADDKAVEKGGITAKHFDPAKDGSAGLDDISRKVDGYLQD